MRRIFTSALLLLSISAAFSAEPKWIHVPSADFEIFSSAGESDTRRVLQHFERVRSFFEQTIKGGVKQAAEPVRIVVFGSKKEYEQYRPNDFSIAYYTQIGGRDYIVLSGVSDDVFPVAVHEYVHLVVQHSGFTLPPWLNEGMAEVYSTLKPTGDKILVGTPIVGRMYELSQTKWVPLATILAADRDSPYYNEKNKAGNLYNEGWALTHMLELSAEYSPRFPQFFLEIAKGVPSQTALENAYGKALEAIEKDLRSYLNRNSFSGRLFSVKLQDGPKAATEPAQAFDVRLTLLDLNNHPGKEAETRQKLSELAGEYPQRPEPQSAMGYLAWRAGEQQQAVKAFGAAFELGGRNPQMLWDYGHMAGSSDAAGAIRALSALLAGQPDRLEVRLALAGVQLSNRQAKDTLATLSPVKQITAKDAPRLFELLAYAHLQDGDAAAARKDAARWLDNAKDGDVRERANRLVSELDNANRVARVSQVPAASPVNAPAGGPPRLTRSGSTPGTEVEQAVPAPQFPSIEGDFVELECTGPTPKLLLTTVAGRVALLMDQPNQVVISGLKSATVDMKCGLQNAAHVSVGYVPADAPETGVKGSVRAIRFE
jgi:Flp pilus assembly protein TadD